MYRRGMAEFDRTFPEVLTALHALPFDDEDGEGVDFEPYDQFLGSGEGTAWLRAWTGDPEVSGDGFRIFGQDGTGGYAAFWLTRPRAPVLAQPIVFFGSEGELGLVARDFADYLWLLAAGLGPYSAVARGEVPERLPNEAFTAFAKRHAPERERAADEIIKSARDEFPRFVDDVRALSRG